MYTFRDGNHLKMLCDFLHTLREKFCLKVCDQITFLTPPPTYLKVFEILVTMAHIFLIHILKFGVPRLGIYEEIIKNVSNK